MLANIPKEVEASDLPMVHYALKFSYLSRKNRFPLKL